MIQVFITAIAMALVLAILLGVVIMFLWNAFCSDVLGLPEITYFQSVVSYFLCDLLFKQSTSTNSKD